MTESHDIGDSKCQANTSIQLGKDHDLSWWHVYLVMKAHRLESVEGPRPNELWWPPCQSERGDKKWTWEITSAIVGNRLLIKVQSFKLIRIFT